MKRKNGKKIKEREEETTQRDCSDLNSFVCLRKFHLSVQMRPVLQSKTAEGCKASTEIFVKLLLGRHSQM